MTPTATPAPVIELARIRLKAGISEDRLIAVSDQFQKDFLAHVDGFLGRDLMRGADGTYMDIVRWSSAQAAEAVMAVAMTSPACRAYFDRMQMSSDASEGVAHMQVLRRYG